MKDKTKRIVMTVFGVIICGFSAGMFDFSRFGMDPFQVLVHGIWKHTSLSFGLVYTVINLIILAADFAADRRKIGLGTFINMFLLGYVVQFSSWLLKTLMPDPDIVKRIVFLALGVLIMCLSAAIYFTADLGVSTYDAVALIISEKKVWKYRAVRIATDVICVAAGVLLGAEAGAGTVIAALFMGPLIAFFRKNVAEPMRYGKKD